MLSPSPETVTKVMEFLRRVISEDRTDEWIELLFARIKLPWWIPGWAARRALDQLLPEMLLDSLEDLLRRTTDA